MTSLKLFNAVLASEGAAPTAAHRAAEIAAHYRAENLSGAQLNRTFHQSWETIQRSPRSELLRHQMLHYLTTYGFAELGIETDFVYFPPEVSELPAVRRAPVRVIHGLTADELAARCRGLLNSGVALAGETLHDLMDLLEEIDRVPTDGGAFVTGNSPSSWPTATPSTPPPRPSSCATSSTGQPVAPYSLRTRKPSPQFGNRDWTSPPWSRPTARPAAPASSAASNPSG